MQGYAQAAYVRRRGRPGTNRKVIAVIICLHGQLEKVLSVIIKGIPLCKVAGPSWDQQTIDGIKPAHTVVVRCAYRHCSQHQGSRKHAVGTDTLPSFLAFMTSCHTKSNHGPTDLAT